MIISIKNHYRQRLTKAIILRIAAVFTLLFFSFANFSIPTAAYAKNEKKPLGKTDIQKLSGKWLRPDGGYVLELKNISENGQMNASYFNPNPIKVFSSEWKLVEGKLKVIIELRDINYPGSKYTLQYDPASDSLKGIYFQAVEKEEYEIEFARKN